MAVFIERVHGLSVAAADNRLGVITVIAGFAGSLAGGWIGDRLLRRWREAYLWLCGVSTLVAVPCAWLAITLPAPYYLYALFVVELLLFLSTGPVNSSVLGVVAPAMRAAAMALSTFAIHAFGDCWSPLLIGYLSDRSSIAQAVTIIPVSLAIGGAIWLFAAWRGERRPVPGAVS
jgi:MFS transporter, Spinster family, sphingosine-1-phosphate transporter